MKPGRYDFRVPRGGIPFLAVRLHGQDPRTLEVRRLPIPGVTIEWTIDWPDEPPEVRTQFSDEPLKLDPRSGFVMFPVAPARLEALEVAGRPVDTRIRLLMADGTPVPFLAGTISLEC